MPEPAPAAVVDVALDQSIALRASGDIGRLVVSQPEIVEVRSTGDDGLYVIGRELGEANLLVFDRAGRLSQTVDVRVSYDAQALRESLAVALPDETIMVTLLSSGLVLDGEISNAAAAEIALRLAEQAAPDAVTSRLRVRESQVRLDVRIFEVGSRHLQDIGSQIALSDGAHLHLRAGTGLIGAGGAESLARARLTSGHFRLDAVLRGLETRGRLEMLAEPTLVTLSGMAAHFRAGGEAPILVQAPDGRVTVEFKPYGTSVSFQPHIQSNGLIRLQLDAQRSELDPTAGLRTGSFNVSGLLVRRAATTLELREGESYLVAGLFEDSARTMERSAPFASRAPLIGPLIKTVQRADERRELAIMVTARIVRDDGGAPPAPTVLPDARTPKAVSAPRGPPLRVAVEQVRNTFGPPVRWLKRQTLSVLSALGLRD